MHEPRFFPFRPPALGAAGCKPEEAGVPQALMPLVIQENTHA